MAEAGTFRTDDLGLAVTLSCSGYVYELEKFTEMTVRWCFADPGTEEFDDLIGDYQEFNARVEPRQFMGRWAEMRREFFELIPRRPRPRPSAIPASQPQ
jgi:hypothetical protein